MPHTVSGKLRKAPFVKSGVGKDGQSTMFIIELSEVTKDRQTGQNTYTNYSAALFAKTPKAIEYYSSALAEGSFVVVSCEKLTVRTDEHQGKTYTKLIMDNANLTDANIPTQNQVGTTQYQQSANQQSQQQSPQYNEPPVDFSDDIPFAPIGLMHSNNYLHCI